MSMNPDGKASKCLRALRDGAATTAEVAADVGFNTRVTCAHLSNLFHDGKITRREFHIAGQRQCWLWSVVETSADVG